MKTHTSPECPLEKYYTSGWVISTHHFYEQGWKSLLVCWALYAIIFVSKGQLSPVQKKKSCDTENNNWWCNGSDSDPSPVKNWAFEDSFSWYYINTAALLEYSTTCFVAPDPFVLVMR